MAAVHSFAGRVQVGGTATGPSTDYLNLPYAATLAQAVVLNGATTSATLTVQGRVSGSTLWFDISAATAITATGVATRVVSTSTAVFDNVRTNISANEASASTKAFTIWVTAVRQ